MVAHGGVEELLSKYRCSGKLAQCHIFLCKYALQQWSPRMSGLTSISHLQWGLLKLL